MIAHLIHRCVHRARPSLTRLSFSPRADQQYEETEADAKWREEQEAEWERQQAAEREAAEKAKAEVSNQDHL